MNKYVVWLLGAVASIYGAIAASFFDHIPLSAVSFGLLAIIFVLAAYRELAAGNKTD